MYTCMLYDLIHRSPISCEVCCPSIIYDFFFFFVPLSPSLPLFFPLSLSPFLLPSPLLFLPFSLASSAASAASIAPDEVRVEEEDSDEETNSSNEDDSVGSDEDTLAPPDGSDSSEDSDEDDTASLASNIADLTSGEQQVVSSISGGPLSVLS